MSLVEDSLQKVHYYGNSAELEIIFKSKPILFSYHLSGDPESPYSWYVDTDSFNTLEEGYLSPTELSFLGDILEELKSNFKVDLEKQKIYHMKLTELVGYS